MAHPRILHGAAIPGAETELAIGPFPPLDSVGLNASFLTFLLLRNPRFMVDNRLGKARGRE